MMHEKAPDNEAGENGIIIRDRRKPNQYTTDNVIAREWLPILRVGDAFFFYSVYLSMANRETESSWGSLRTMAQYLQCSVDLIIRGNKLLEICELIFIETGNQYTTNEYYILDPPSLTPELGERINSRLDDIEAQEKSKNWQSWVKQVRQSLEQHISLPQIWAQRRANRGGRPIKLSSPGNPVRESQSGLFKNPGCGTQPGRLCSTTTVDVEHNQSVSEPQLEQEKQTSRTNKIDQEEDNPLLQDAVRRCHVLGVATPVLEILIEKYPVTQLQEQLNWLPARHPHDPAAMFVRALQENWSIPPQFEPAQSNAIWAQWLEEFSLLPSPASDVTCDEGVAMDGEGELWPQVLQELEMQMTRATFDRWLRGTRMLRQDEAKIVVGVRDPYALEWLERRLAQTIQRTVQAVVGRPISICYEVA